MGTLTVGGNVINDVWANETLGEVTVSGQLQSLIRCKNNTAGITVASTGPAAGIKMTPGTCSGPVNVFGNLELLAIDTLEAPVAISGDRLQ